MNMSHVSARPKLT